MSLCPSAFCLSAPLSYTLQERFKNNKKIVAHKIGYEFRKRLGAKGFLGELRWTHADDHKVSVLLR